MNEKQNIWNGLCQIGLVVILIIQTMRLTLLEKRIEAIEKMDCPTSTIVDPCVPVPLPNDGFERWAWGKG